jgi:hypothetical protein
MPVYLNRLRIVEISDVGLEHNQPSENEDPPVKRESERVMKLEVGYI